MTPESPSAMACMKVCFGSRSISLSDLMAKEGVVNAERMCAVVAPGFEAPCLLSAGPTNRPLLHAPVHAPDSTPLAHR